MPRILLTAALALAAATAAAVPAAATTDGTSNTIMVAEAVHVDQAHHQLLVRAPARTLPAGRLLGTVQVRTPHYTLLLENTMISGYATAESLSLNFTKVEFMDYTDDALIEEDGTYWLS